MMGLTAAPRKWQPSYKAGYARSAAEARYPQLWRGAVGAWSPGLGVTGDRLRDQSGHNSHGTLTNMAPATDWLMDDGYALDFDGTDAYVSFGTLIQQQDRISLSLWVKTTDTSPVDSHAAFVSRWPSSWLLWSNAGNIILGDADSSELGWTGGDAILADGVWHHLCGVIDGATGYIYLDSVLKASGGSFSISSSVVEVMVGAYSGGASGRYGGLIDDVRIYDRALSPSEITLLAARRSITYELKLRKAYYVAAAAAIGGSIIGSGVSKSGGIPNIIGG